MLDSTASQLRGAVESAQPVTTATMTHAAAIDASATTRHRNGRGRPGDPEDPEDPGDMVRWAGSAVNGVRGARRVSLLQPVLANRDRRFGAGRVD